MAKVLFKFGTKAQYLALENKQENALYFLLDTGELYRGEVPFSQEHLYTGNRPTDATDAAAITTILNGETPIHGDLLTITNSDNTVDSFAYNANNDTWIRLSTSSSELADIRATISELRILAAGALHFKDVVNNLNEVTNPNQGDVYQVGDKEYAWNGSSWVEFGSPIDISNLATKAELADAVADLETLLGHPAGTDPDTGDPIPATGVYTTLSATPESIIPVFNGTNYGLVPRPNIALSSTDKANLILNANGVWIPASSAGTDIEWEELGT